MGNAESIDADLPANDAKTPSESPPSGVRSIAASLTSRVEAALESSARTEAALADIFRTAKYLSATVKAVRDANAVLRRELVGLQAEALHDHDLLVADHDEFIAMLLTDHEREIQALREKTAIDESDEEAS